MRDQAELVGELVNMEKKVQYFNGQADKEDVRNALNAVAARRQVSEEAALAQDPFIAENIMANTALDSEDKLRIGRKANQMRQSQEYAGGAKKFNDKHILNKVSMVANQSSASGFGQRGGVSPAMEPVVGAGQSTGERSGSPVQGGRGDTFPQELSLQGRGAVPLWKEGGELTLPERRQVRESRDDQNRSAVLEEGAIFQLGSNIRRNATSQAAHESQPEQQKRVVQTAADLFAAIEEVGPDFVEIPAGCQLADNYDKAISMDQFVAFMANKGCANETRDTPYDRLFHSMQAYDMQCFFAVGDFKKYRFVKHPYIPNLVIDMRHFFLISVQGEGVANLVEDIQSIFWNESAYHEQDLASNELGFRFYNFVDTYGGEMSLLELFTRFFGIEYRS